ncbi:MAG TPA: gliding motility-associated C-terminal domain-containing protein [Chitinophagales bacterium]|nr:gliding motility-associated C-terminal domain-containing protein [Chitinophagales bacterium]HNA39609.1 gliding motility-associated C-terminal domain-containing protein [Chitinophagales bacterium]
MRNKLLLLLLLFLSKSIFSQTIQLNSLSPTTFCATGKDTFKFAVNYSNIPANSNIVFYQSTNPSFNPYAGQGDSIGFINVGSNTSNGGPQVITTCPEILGIFLDACDPDPLEEQDNEYIVITSGQGFLVNNLQVDVPATSNRDINIPLGSNLFGTPSAALMAQLRIGSCNASNLIAAKPGDSIPPNAIVIIFPSVPLAGGNVYAYNFSSYCSSGQPIYILQNSYHQPNGSFANNPPGSCPGATRSTTIRNRSCVSNLVYNPCSLPAYDAGNPNANDGNYAIKLPANAVSSSTNGGIRNNAADICNGLRFDSIVGNSTIKYPIPNDGSANVSTNFCNTGTHYIKAITHPNASQPISNTLQFELICLDISTNVTSLSICDGATANINISSTDPNATFSWTVSGGAGITGATAGTGNNISQILNYSGGTKDSVTYTITATHGACTKSTNVKVVVNKCNTCTAFNLGNDTSYCSTFSRVLSTGNPATVWSTGVTGSSITVNQLGTYHATCGAFSDTIKLTAAPGINFDFGANSTSVCAGGSISLSAGTTYDSYIWSTGAQTPSITITQPDKYWVDVFKNGCKGTDTIQVLQITTEPKPNLGSDVSVCSPVSQNLTTGKALTTWYLNNTSNQVGSGANYTATQFGSYIAKVSNSCGDVFDTIVITQSNTQTPIHLGNDTSYCGPFSRVLSTGNAATVWSTGVTASSITVTTAGTYTATINTGCGVASDAITITQNAGINFDFGANSTSVCVGGTINLSAGSTYDSYVWSTGAQTSSITVSQAGKYWVDVFKNGCKGTDSIQVVEIDKEPTPNLGRDTTFCGTFSLTLNSGNQLTQWLRNGNILTSNTSSITATQAGTYIARITNSCGTVADTLVISNSNTLSVNLGRDTAICNNNSIVLNATTSGNNISYLWNTGAQTPTISVNQLGKYDVKVSNGICAVVDTVFVDVLDKPTLSPIGNDTSFCGVFSHTLFTGDANTHWSTGATGPQISVTQAGTYIAENRNQCGSASDTIVIKQFAAPQVNIGRDTTICDSIQLSVGNGNFVSILWSTNDTTPSIIAHAQGIYTVTVRNQNCAKTDSINIIKKCMYEVYIPTAFSPNADGFNDVYVPLTNLNGVQVLRFIIFNRWSEKVYEADNFTPNDITKGWNGTFKGEPAQQDNYVYYFTVKLPDNSEKTYKGTFALLR